jgi:Uma2 family endonuclease
VLIVNPIPLAEETGPNEFLGYLLIKYREEHPQGKLLDYTLPEQYVRTGKSRRRADRLIWIGLGRLPNVKKDVPAIAVEFVSEGKRNVLRDYVEKKREYLALGLGEYWIIDRFRRIMTVFRNQPGEAEEIVVPEEETYQSPLLPGFEVPLARLLQLADQLAQAE